MQVLDVQKNRNLRDDSTQIKVRARYLSSRKPLDDVAVEGKKP
jgi:hypothetical protein